jgi:hypothetical protein
MSTIPLPALQVHTAETPDPIGNFTRILQLRDFLQNEPVQRQILQQQQQAGQVDVEQKQQQLKDQQAMSSAMQNWDGKDVNSLVPLVIKQGASANAVMGLKSKILEQQQAYSKMASDDATTGSKNIETLKNKNDMLAGRLSTVLTLPDEQLPHAITQAAQELGQQGILDPQHAQTAAQLAQLPPAQIRAQLGIMEKGLMSQTQQIDQAQKSAQAQKDTAQAGEAQARATQIQQQTQYGPTGDAAEAQYRYVLARIQQGLPVSSQEMANAKAYEASNSKTSTTSDTLGVTSANTSRPAGLASVGGVSRGPAAPQAQGGSVQAAPATGSQSPTSTRDSVVDIIGQYRYDSGQLSRLVAKHPDILALVQQKYPDFDQTTYQAKNKLIQSYTSGTQSKEINAINTAMGHVKVLDDAVDALNNGNVQLLNSIGNKLGIATGSTPQTTFQAIVHRVGPEITTAYLPGGGGEGERIANEKDFSENLAPQQLHDNAAITVKLLRSKVGALENQYQNTVGRNDFNQRFITPEAQAAFDKFGGGNSGGSLPSGSGRFIDAATAQQFYKAAGNDPAKARQMAIANGWKVQ